MTILARRFSWAAARAACERREQERKHHRCGTTVFHLLTLAPRARCRPTRDSAMTDAVYRTVAAFAARLAALGTTEAVISPGSRSTPLTLCFDAQPGMRSWIQLDERSRRILRSRHGPGLGPARGAGMHLGNRGRQLPARCGGVLPRGHSHDRVHRRPSRGTAGLGARPRPSTRWALYGTAVRWSIDLPTPDEAGPGTAAGWPETAVASASGRDPGPVHLNWPLREPLEPMPTLQEPVAHRSIPQQLRRAVAGTDADPSGAGGIFRGDRRRACRRARRRLGMSPLAVALQRRPAPPGMPTSTTVRLRRRSWRSWPGSLPNASGGWWWPGRGPAGDWTANGAGAAAAERFAAWAGWPLVGEPVAHVRGRSHPGGNQERSRCVVATADHLLADETLGEALRPDAAVLVGRTATTKPVRQWLERTRPRHVVLIDPEDRWKHAVFRLTGHVPASVKALSTVTSGAAPPGRGRDGDWLDTWAKLDRAARSAIGEAIDDRLLLSARAARVLAGALPADAVLVATNSLPVRDLDAFVFDTGSVTCCANRGAAGIDGSASTALGIAAADPSRVVALYTGDLALLHDLSGLAAAARLGLHLIVVCVDNDGGEIFSLLPVADRVPARDFERLFRTPHGLDLCGLDGLRRHPSPPSEDGGPSWTAPCALLPRPRLQVSICWSSPSTGTRTWPSAAP